MARRAAGSIKLSTKSKDQTQIPSSKLYFNNIHDFFVGGILLTNFKEE